MVDQQRYEEYMRQVSTLAGLDTAAGAEVEKLRAEQQIALREASQGPRKTESHIEKVRSDLRSLESRLTTLNRSYGESPQPDEHTHAGAGVGTGLGDLEQTCSALAQEVESLEGVDGWLRRNRQQLTTKTAQFATQTTPVAPTTAYPVPQQDTARPRKSGGIAWYWWAGGGVVTVGIVGAIVAGIVGG